jgi:hypothetical protein
MQVQTQNSPSSRDGDALFQTLKKEGCPICLMTLEAIQRAMDQWLYEGFTDAENRERLVRSHGFCARHTWQLARLPASLQLAQVYQSTLPEILTSLTQSLEQVKQAKKTQGKSFWSKWLKRRDKRGVSALPAPCTLCQTQRESEERLVTTLLTMLCSEPFCERMRLATTGFCLPHFTQIYDAANNDEQRSFLLNNQCLCAQRLQEELAELIRKHDYRFQKEPQGDEMIA